MAHFAELDNDNIVIRVLAMDNLVEDEALDWLTKNLEGVWVQTSYNATIRKNFAGVGFTFDEQRDAFIAPKPSESWVLNEETVSWEAPTPMPADGKPYYWNEAELNWVELIPIEIPVEEPNV